MSDAVKAKKLLLVGLAEVYGESITAERLSIYIGALTDLSVEDLKHAIDQIVRDVTICRFPLPAVIREKIFPTSTVESAAQILLGRAIEAVARFGYVDPEGAKEFIGEIGWKAIGAERGWQDLCVSEVPQGILRAQLRGQIAAKLHHEFPSGRVLLPEPKEAPLRIAVTYPGEKIAIQNQLLALEGKTPDRELPNLTKIDQKLLEIK